MPSLNAIVLAAGKSKRMKSATPKVLHKTCGRPLVFFPVNTVRKVGACQIVIVINGVHKKDFAETFLGNKDVSFAIQRDALGTADAVRTAYRAVDKANEYTLIIPGDVPLIKPETLKQLARETILQNAVCGILTMKPNDPSDYGRIIRDGLGNVQAIVEKHDATEAELAIPEVNSSIYCAKTNWLFAALKKILPENSQKEYYLTDIIKIASDNGQKVIAQKTTDPDEALGVNTRSELALANRLMRYRIIGNLMETGVGIEDELHTYIDFGVEIGTDTKIAPNCFISGATKIGKNCTIENGVVLKNTIIADCVHIKPYSVIEESIIRCGAQIGPFARLRPGTIVEASARIGNFVEVKKSLIKKGAKANHLSYIGDAVIGTKTNIGCGTITCNYDGKNKHKTVIGNDVFVGSDVQFVAPVKIGHGAVIGAGSTITDDVPANTLAIARERQVVKRNWKKIRKFGNS